MRFPLGQVVATPGALAAVPPDEIQKALSRHAANDWGDLCEEDKALNDVATYNGDRIMSAYHTKETLTKFWIITEADRSSTCVLLPSEY